MSDRPGRRATAELLRRHGVRPRRSLGQHFLIDPNIVSKIVRLTETGLGDRVLEVGTGTGNLTRALAEAALRVRSYEVDERLRPLLAEVLAGFPNVDLRFQDALQADLPATLGEGAWTMAANLPYHVGTPLLLILLREAPQLERFVVMLQRETAERLVASPGTKTYGIPSVIARLYAEVDITFRVPPQVFLPPPPVESAVVVLQRLGGPPHGAGRAVELAMAAFGKRRKMLRRSLGGILEEPARTLAAAGIDPTARAEQLSPDDYLRLAAAVDDAR
ncbi:MAG: 16S rRNA (adenine(1518)-N(6)/adenine(1519)-N(6))-dimethyltransferase RsmA [Acidimicrobiia bacterium]